MIRFSYARNRNLHHCITLMTKKTEQKLVSGFHDMPWKLPKNGWNEQIRHDGWLIIALEPIVGFQRAIRQNVRNKPTNPNTCVCVYE